MKGFKARNHAGLGGGWGLGLYRVEAFGSKLCWGMGGRGSNQLMLGPGSGADSQNSSSSSDSEDSESESESDDPEVVVDESCLILAC